MKIADILNLKSDNFKVTLFFNKNKLNKNTEAEIAQTNKNKLRTSWSWNWNLFRIIFLIKILKSAKYHIVCICTIIFLPWI